MAMSLPVKQQVVRVNVKLVPDADRARSVSRLADATGVRTVVQTFPDETDQDLSGLYMLEVDPPNLESILEKLRKVPEVEYAEVAPSRRLVR